MVVTLLAEDQSEFFVNVNELHDLRDTGFADAAEVREKRPIDEYMVETLTFSNPRAWDPILVTKTDIGYIVLDGNHRWQAARERKMEQIKATCKTFENEDQVIDAAYTGNFLHGTPANKETRSSYGYWLYKKHYPQMTQKEIAHKAGIAQSTLSEAIARREQPAQEPPQSSGKKPLTKKEPAPSLITPATEEEQRRVRRRKEARTMIRDMTKFLDDIKDLDEDARRAEIMDLFASTEDRNHFLATAHLIEEVLEPPKPTPPRKKRQT